MSYWGISGLSILTKFYLKGASGLNVEGIEILYDQGKHLSIELLMR